MDAIRQHGALALITVRGRCYIGLYMSLMRILLVFLLGMVVK